MAPRKLQPWELLPPKPRIAFHGTTYTSLACLRFQAQRPKRNVASSPQQYFQDLGSSILSFTGALAKQTATGLVGAVLSFTGVLSGRANKVFTAILSFTGSFSKAMSRVLTGILSFAGSFSTFKLANVIMTAALSFTGAMTRKTSRGITAALSFTGLSLRGIVKGGFTATLTFTGSTIRRGQKTFNATLDPTGAFVRLAQKPLVAALSFTGAFSRTILKSLGAALSFVGNLAGIKRRFVTFVVNLTTFGSLTTLRWYFGPFKKTSIGVLRAVSRAINNLITQKPEK